MRELVRPSIPVECMGFWDSVLTRIPTHGDRLMKWHMTTAQGYVNIRLPEIGKTRRVRAYHVVFGGFARKYHFFLVPVKKLGFIGETEKCGGKFMVYCKETGMQVGVGGPKRLHAMVNAEKWLESTGSAEFYNWITDWGLAVPRKIPAHKGYTRAAWRLKLAGSPVDENGIPWPVAARPGAESSPPPAAPPPPPPAAEINPNFT